MLGAVAVLCQRLDHDLRIESAKEGRGDLGTGDDDCLAAVHFGGEAGIRFNGGVRRDVPAGAEILGKRALLMDPDNFTMRWNLTCALSRFLGDKDGAIDLLATFVDRAPPSFVEYLRLDTDLDPLREDPRFENLAATAEQRVAASRTAAA